MPEQLIAAGGVVFRIPAVSEEPQVLLIYRNGVWDIPKGKLEKGESIPMCAVREVAEETGAELPVLVSDLGTTYHEYKQNGKEFGKTTYWYSMVFTGEQKLKPQKNEGIEKIQWVPLRKANEQVGFENLKKVLAAFSKTLNK